MTRRSVREPHERGGLTGQRSTCTHGPRSGVRSSVGRDAASRACSKLGTPLYPLQLQIPAMPYQHVHASSHWTPKASRSHTSLVGLRSVPAVDFFSCTHVARHIMWACLASFLPVYFQSPRFSLCARVPTKYRGCHSSNGARLSILWVWGKPHTPPLVVHMAARFAPQYYTNLRLRPASPCSRFSGLRSVFSHDAGLGGTPGSGRRAC